MSSKPSFQPSSRGSRPTGRRSGGKLAPVGERHMELSGELFKSIISQLTGNDNTADQRAEPRVGLRNEVAIRLLNDSKSKETTSYTANVRDLSRHGIGLVTPLYIPVEGLFAIRLPVYGNKAVVAVYKVTHSEMLEEEMFSIGGQLMKIRYPDGKEGLTRKDAAAKAASKPGVSKSADRVLPPGAAAGPGGRRSAA